MCHQGPTNANSPVRWVHGDGVEFSKQRIDRVSRGPHAHHAEDEPVKFGDCPVRSRLRQVVRPAGNALGSVFPNPEEVPEACVPGLDVDPSDILSVVGHGGPYLNHGLSVARYGDPSGGTKNW